jgi:hypothetical protein
MESDDGALSGLFPSFEAAKGCDGRKKEATEQCNVRSASSVSSGVVGRLPGCAWLGAGHRACSIWLSKRAGKEGGVSGSGKEPWNWRGKRKAGNDMQ